MSSEPEEIAYCLRLMSVCIDIGKETVLDVFVHHSLGKNPEKFLQSKEQALVKLKNDGILNKHDCDLLLKVQYLIEKVKGFDSYFTNKCDRYEKYTALLVKDGYFALSTFLDKEVKKDGRDLCNILDDNKDSFRRDLTSKQLDVLYPSTKGSAQLDPSTWDVGLLATVILNIFGNSIARLARKLIKYIGDASQDYAEKAIIALDGNKFEKISTELRTKILILSEYIDEETANRCEMILDECEASDAFKTNMDMLKTQDTLMKSFTDIQEETLQRTKKCLQEMITNGISFGQSHELDLKMITLGTDEENKKFAEEVLTDIWKESLDRSKETEIFPEVKKEVLKILEEIKKGKNAKSFSIEMGSIILRISFKTPREMLSTIHYFESRSFQEAIGNIAEGLGYYFNTAFAVFTVMPIDSLWGILNPQSSLARAQEYGIRLSISVSSPADMLQLRSLIVSEKIAKSTQSISEALSDHFSGKITVKAKADMKELENVYDGENTTTASGNKPKKDIDLLMEDIGYRLLQGAEANTTEKQHNVETLLDKIRDHEVHQVDLGVSASAGEDYDSNIQETTQQMPSQSQDDEVSLEKENVTPREKDYADKIGKLEAVDDAKTSQGLGAEDLMDSIQLNELVSNEGRNSPNVKKECDKICAALKTESDQIVRVWPSYRLKENKAIIFVVIAKRDIKLDVSWTLEVRILHQYSEESKRAMYCEDNSPLSTQISRQIGDIIDKHAVELMQKHSYLSAISASSVISKHYGRNNQKILPKPCIVLSVLVKQFIPINEEPFPTMLDGIPVDVREGGVQLCGASAKDFHEQVRMGCQISSSFLPSKFGTLGGFVEHPEYGLCGFTCAHTILNDNAKLAVKGKGNMKGKDLGLCEIFQPSFASENKIGRVVEMSYKEGKDNKSGVDLALFKIEQRQPTEGNFPDNRGTTTTIKYESGKVLGKDGIPTHQPLVQKFGVVTGLTYGHIQFNNAVIKEIPFHSQLELDSGKLTTTLYGQYHIKSDDVNVRFSELGDSGALVFMKDEFDREGDLRCIGMIEGVWDDNTCAVTPIMPILEELKVTQLKSFIPIVTWKKIDERLKEMEDRLMKAIIGGKTNEQIPSQ